MSTRSSWLLVPAALVALLAVLSLVAAVAPARCAETPDAWLASPVEADLVFGDAATASAAAGDSDLVVLEDATGRRSAPLPFSALTADAVLLDCGADLAGRRVSLRVFRRLPSGRESQAWLTALPRVRDDGILPVAGLPAGCCDFEVVVPGDPAPSLSADAVTLPADAARPVPLQLRSAVAPR
ncbi:MAG TPA: hypothetical protein VK348_03775 [Planctomycetota bacterium]|nr:hypothetical protein [Planctomycetota bacterium]